MCICVRALRDDVPLTFTAGGGGEEKSRGKKKLKQNSTFDCASRRECNLLSVHLRRDTHASKTAN